MHEPKHERDARALVRAPDAQRSSSSFMEDEDGADQEYSWEGIYERPWEAVREAWADGNKYGTLTI